MPAKKYSIDATVTITLRCNIATFRHGKVEPESFIHSDSWRGYNASVDLAYKKLYRVFNERSVLLSCGRFTKIAV